MPLGKGKEVADAFIDIHGDLSSFRRELDKANEDMAKLARQKADTFSEEWGKRMAGQMDRQWGSVVDNLYNAEGIDLNRMIKDFNAKDLDDAETKINEFIHKMSQHRKINGDLYKDVKKQLNDAIAATRAQEAAEEALASQRVRNNLAYKKMIGEINDGLQEQADRRNADQKAWERANADMVAKFREIRKAYDESFDGMFATEQAKRLTDELKNMVTAMADADWSKFAKGFDSLDDMRAHIEATNQALLDQGKITRQNFDDLTAGSDAWIDAEKERQRLIIENARLSKEASEDEKRLQGEALDAARKAREESERLDRTFEAMIAKGAVRKMEDDFKRLADAVATNNWDGITRGHKNFDEMEASIRRVLDTYKELGLVSEDTMLWMNGQLEDMRNNADAYGISFGRANDNIRDGKDDIEDSNIAMKLLEKSAANAAGKLRAMAGFNLVTDMIREGSEFMQNLDRNAVSFARTLTTASGAASGLIGALGGAVTVLSDVGRVAGGLALFAPGFIAGLGIGVGVLVASFKDMKKVLADLGPSFNKLQDTISASFWKQAAQPIRDLANTMLPLLNEKLSVTAENLGGMFKEFADSLADSSVQRRAGEMFDRMNSAIRITQGMMRPLTNAFVTLADFGSLYFERFGKWLVDISNQFNDFIQTAAENGDLQRWMDEAIDGLKDLWSIAGDVVGIFNSINKAATEAGAKGLHGFREAMDEVAKVMASDRFQKAMTTVFSGAFEVLAGMKRGFKGLADDIESFLPTYTDIMNRFSRIFESAFGFIGTFISNKDFQNGLSKFVQGIEKAVGNLKPAIDPAATSFGGLLDLMGKVLDTGSKLVSEVLVKLGPKFDAIVAAIEPLIKPAGAIGSSAIDALSAVLDFMGKTVLPPVVKFLEKIAPAIEGALKQITPESLKRFEMLGDALNGIADAAGAVADALGPLQAGQDLEWLGDLLFSGGGPGGKFGGNGNPLEDMFKNWFNGINWEDFGKTIADGWNRLWSGNIFGDQPGKWFREADENMNQWWDDTIGSFWDDTIGKWLEDARKTIEDAWNGFTGWLDDLFGGGGNDGNDNVRGGGGIGGRSVGSVIGLGDLEDPSAWETFWSNVQSNITTFFEGIGSWIEEQSATLKEGWDTFWGGFGDKVKEVWDGFWTFITEKYTEITTGLTTWWTDLQLGWNTFWDGVGTKVREIWDGVATWISTKYTEIKTGIDTWISDVKTNWDNFWKGVNDKVVEIWNAVASFIDTKKTEIKTNIDNFINDVRTNWDNFWTGVRNTVTDAWIYVTNWIANKVVEIRMGIFNFINDVRMNWDNFWTGVGTIVRTKWDEISRTVQTKVDEVVRWVQSLPEKIKGFFNVDLSGAGAAIMNSFKRGLESSWGAVTDFVGGIAGWIAANKGPISYDRILLTPAGRAIMAGLVGGLEDGMSDLESTIDKVTNTMRDKVTEALAVSAMYRAGADAALGLADGLASQKNAISSTFDSLLPDVKTIPISASSGSVEGVGTTTPTRVVTFEDGAVRLEAPQADPALVVDKLLDEIVETASTL